MFVMAVRAAIYNQKWVLLIICRVTAAATGFNTERNLDTIGVCGVVWHSSIFGVCAASNTIASVVSSSAGCTGRVSFSMGATAGGGVCLVVPFLGFAPVSRLVRGQVR